MRGKPVSRAARKDFDVVIVAARYDEDRGILKLAQGYERHGLIWRDVKLYSRPSLLSLIKDGKRVVAGALGDLPGDFQAIRPMGLHGQNGSQFLHTGEAEAAHDDLGVPLF